VDFDLTKRVLAALEREGVRYVIFGAVALNLLGLPRATEDLDLFIAPERDNIERMKAALRSVFHDPAIDEITAEDLLGEYPAIQYAPPEEGFHIDILTRLGELFAFDSVESERLEFDGVLVSVVTLEQLYRMKRGTVRPKDWGDAARIAEHLGIKEK
jgi:predicted nucleotidyltransferase